MDLEKLEASTEMGDGKCFIQNVLANLRRRFLRGFRMQSPFNALTPLDPRFVDLYALEGEGFKKIEVDICQDSVYDDLVADYVEVEKETEVFPVNATSTTSDRRFLFVLRKYS